MKKRTSLIAAIVIIGLLGLAYYHHSLSPINSHDDVRVSVTIPQGVSLKSIASILKKKDLIRSELMFRIYSKLHKVEASLKAGNFILRPSMTTEEIARALESGKGEEITVTIPEGYTVKDIDALLAEKGLSQPGALLECSQSCDVSEFDFLPTANNLARRGGKLEGYLYPDTYFVSTSDFSMQAFVKRLLTTFQKNVVDGEKDALKASGHSLHEVVTMASLIEGEAGSGQEERATVSGILWKRLKEKMGLDVDAAVRYVLDKSKGSITRDDLDVDSPYNLRRVRGLPPGPIGNPGLATIEAALHPKSSPYYYYLHDKNGQIHYAVTNDEHNINRAKYL